MRRIAIALFLLATSASLAAQETKVLIPIFLEPWPGAHGSRFVTTLTVRNASSESMQIKGLWSPCQVTCSPYDSPPIIIPAREMSDFFAYDANSNPGRVALVPATSRIEFGLRVYDETQRYNSFGTEIPVVREEQFLSGPFSLLGVAPPRDDRTNLRIYAFENTTVSVSVYERRAPTIDGPDYLLSERTVEVSGAGPLGYPGAGTDHYRPAFAQLLDLVPPNVEYPVRVEIEPSNVPVWAFATATNNLTQVITTVTPALNR